MVTATMLEGFARYDTNDDSTLVCRCGARFTWTLLDERLEPWVKEHKPHFKLVDTTLKMTEPLSDEHLRAVLEDGMHATPSEAEVMAGELLSLRSQVAELQRGFDLRWDADMKAITRWQLASSDRDLVFPDHVDLCSWLLERLSLERKKVDRCGEIEKVAKEVLFVHDFGHASSCKCSICILRRAMAPEETVGRRKIFRWTRGRRRMMHLLVRLMEGDQVAGHTPAEENLLELIDAGFVQIRVTEAGVEALADDMQSDKED